MIVSMSRIEIVGPRSLLLDVLSSVREAGVLQIDAEAASDGRRSGLVKTMLFDEEVIAERLFLENLARQIAELTVLVPDRGRRTEYIDPRAAIDTVAAVVQQHVSRLREIKDGRNRHEQEKNELVRHAAFIETVGPLMMSARRPAGLEFIGVTVRDRDGLSRLRELVSALTDGAYELVSVEAGDGSLVGLITAERSRATAVRKALSNERLPEMRFPAAFDGLDLPGKIAYIGERIRLLDGEIAGTDAEIGEFAGEWMPLYGSVADWIGERLRLISAAGAAYETEMTFFVTGWIPVGETRGLAEKLGKRFGGSVIVEERAIREQDLDHVPVALRNPQWLKPFESLSRLLPLPVYDSYDPTPFIGVFFPVFFGIMLGDAGYGTVLFLAALAATRRWPPSTTAGAAARILLPSALFAVLFGGLYGEFFGTAGSHLLLPNVQIVDRREAVLPMLYFTVALGVFHVVLGLALGAVAALRRSRIREALVKILHVLALAGISLIVLSRIMPVPAQMLRIVPAATALSVLLLVIAGGLIAPLELLKNAGNVVSYARIMAIGLTSVFLAHVANSFAGMAGSAAAGIIGAVFLHLVSLVLGVFSPAIHALRLHYVEFFGKFIVAGGRKFEPLKK